MHARLKSNTYHLRPVLEPLEQRRLLTAVTGEYPIPGSHDAPVTTDISAVFDTEINPVTVSAESFAVHAMQTRQVLDSLSVSGDTITLSPVAPFHAGELVQVTATTGIQNLGGEPLDDPYVWQFRTAASGGTGFFGDSGQSLGNALEVALGDVDGDGDLDAFVGNRYGSNPGKEVWLNDGSGMFTDSGQSLGDSRTLAVALGDVDGDGDLDAYVGNDDQPNRVWLNDSSGTFTDSGQSLGNSGSFAVALGDVDGDGDLDAIMGNHGQPTTVWLNDGSGTFANSGQSLGNSGSFAVALADVDGDRDLDAFIGNFFASNASNKVWLNDGNGNFSDSGQGLGNSKTAAVALGDVDSDGDLDAFVGNSGQPNTVWLNDGSGTFTHSGENLGDSRSSDVALGDVDGDGDLDALIGNYPTDRVWLNDGSGSFSDSGQSVGDSGSHSVALGDVDGDGDLDAFIANRGNNKVWLNADILSDLSVATTNGQFLATPGQSVAYTITVTNHGPEGVTGAIVTDNFPVVITDVSWTCTASAGASCTPSGTGSISDTISLPVGGTAVYTATGQLSPTASGRITNVATVAAPMGLDDIGPTNNTARDTDVVLGLNLTPEPASHIAPVDTDISVQYDDNVDPATVSAQSFAVHATQTSHFVESLSVSGDTITLSPAAPFHPGELVQATLAGGIENLGGEPLADPFVWQFRAEVGTGNGLGTGLFNDSGQNLGDLRAVALGDVDGDGDLDVVTNNKVWLNDGSGTFTDSGQRLSSFITAVALGDVDGDGDLDAFIGGVGGAGFAPGRNEVWLNDGSGNFSDSGQRLGDSRVSAAALGDLDGDGDLDAVVAGYKPILFAGVTNKVWLNDGWGTFSDSGQSFGGTDTSAVALGDLDGDGDLDACLTGRREPANDESNQPDKVWLNDGSGNFSDSGQSLGSRSTAVALGDLDGDGDLDAFVGGELNNVWVNDGNGTFSDSGQTLVSQSDSVALGDVDGDGDLDAFIGTNGTNKVWLNDGNGTFSDSGQRLGDGDGAVALGDVDRDGDLDAFVVDANEPGKVWLNQDPLPGDFDNDQEIDGDDFLIWQAGFGIQSGATRYDGDADRDGDVDGEDFVSWQGNFGGGSNGGAAGFAARLQAEQRGSAVDDVLTRLRRPVRSVAWRPPVDEIREDRMVVTSFDGSDATWILERTMESPRRREAADRSQAWVHRTETDIAFESLTDKPLGKLLGPLHL